MRINDVDTDNLIKLKLGDLDNFFKVHKDKLGRYMLNLNETLYINVDTDSLETFVPDYDMHWTLISHRLYGTTRLAWVLLKINNVTPISIFNKVQAGTPIFYISAGDVQSILESIVDN